MIVLHEASVQLQAHAPQQASSRLKLASRPFNKIPPILSVDVMAMSSG